MKNETLIAAIAQNVVSDWIDNGLEPKAGDKITPYAAAALRRMICAIHGHGPTKIQPGVILCARCNASLAGTAYEQAATSEVES